MIVGPGILDCNNATVEGRSYRTGFTGAPPGLSSSLIM